MAEIAQQAAASSSSFSFQPSETAMYSSSSSSSSSSFSFTEPAPKCLTMSEMLNSAEYVAGRELIKNDNLDEAIDHFNSLLEKTYVIQIFYFYFFYPLLLSDNDVLPSLVPPFALTESKVQIRYRKSQHRSTISMAVLFCIKPKNRLLCLRLGPWMEMRVEVRSNRKWGMENPPHPLLQHPHRQKLRPMPMQKGNQ